MTGRVVHFEIPADDFDRATAFYQSAFGWNINRKPEFGYAFAGGTPTDENGVPLEAGSINGGMLTRDETVNRPVVTIQVDDIDQALERIAELGGETVQPKQEVLGMGFAAYFRDSEGNLMGLWQEP